MVRNAVVLGEPTLSTIGGYTLWGASNPRVVDDPTLAGRWVRTSELVDADHPLSGGELERDAAARRYGLTFLNEHRRDVPWLVVMRLWRFVSPFEPTPNRLVFWAFALSWLVTAPWFVAGLVVAWRENRRIALVLVAPLLATSATVIMFYGSIRFRDSIAPVFVALAAGALEKSLSSFAANGAIVGTRARSRF